MADEPAPPLPSSTQPARARRRRIFFGAALFHAALLALVTGAGAETVPPAGRIVVLISIDGFPAWVWKDPTLVVPHLRQLAAEGAQAEEVRGFSKGKSIVWRDAIWTRAASHIVEQHQPNLLLFHLLTTDATNHQFGPGSLPSLTAYAYADRLIGDLLDSLARAGLRDKAAIVIATDYGIRAGVKIPRMTNLDVAPTLAELPGVPLPDVDGRVLREILK